MRQEAFERTGRRGLTLIELIAVIVILTIIAGVAAPAMSGFSGARAATAAQHLASDLTAARLYGTTSGQTVWIVVDPPSDLWSMRIEPRDQPGRDNAELMLDPVDGRPHLVELNTGIFAGVQLINCDFGGGSEIGFDWRGRPITADDTPLASTGEAVFTGGARVEVMPGTGLVRYEQP